MSNSINVSGSGSLVSSIYRQSTQPEPVEGVGCTILLWNDRHAATIVRVSADKGKVWVTRDKAIPVGNVAYTESQRYSYERDAEAGEECFSLRKNGRWVRKGEGLLSGTSLLIGARKEYYDWTS